MFIILLLYEFNHFLLLTKNNFTNININEIVYELTYSNSSIINVFILSQNKINIYLEFEAFLISENKQSKLLLKCFKINKKAIKCFSKKYNYINLKIRYFFYYNCLNKCKFLLNNKTIFEDKNKISLIFKPQIYKNQILFKNNKQFIIKKNKTMISSGYIYFTKKNKKILNNLKNGFNKYIDLNNYISAYKTLKEYRSITSYKEAIKKGFHIVDADILFTKDKIPVICHENKLEKISNGKGLLSSKTLKELKQLDFYYDKYKNEKILTFEEFLKFSKDNNIIIDLDLCHLDYKRYFKNTDDYSKIIINIVEKYNMFNSIIFNDGNNIFKLLKLKKFKNDITISISQMNEKKNIEEIKDKFKESKIIIYNMGNLLYGKNINKEAVKFGLSLKNKIKAAKVNDIKFAEKLFSWGVNFITTQYLNPFQLKNEKEEPIKIKCNYLFLKNYSICIIEKDTYLKDNEFYNIYYSDNIYNLYEDININPIGEFKYINTNINHKLYYTCKYINFEEGIIKVIISNILEKGKIIKGIIGPDFDNVANFYLFDFICKGNNRNYLKCLIIKKNKDKLLYKGNYIIYSLENYSFNPDKIKTILNNTKIEKYKIIFYLILIVFLIKIYINFSYKKKN